MFRVIVALLALAGLAAPLHAQTWPARPIRMIVPFPPGGGTDFVSRLVAGELAKSTGWTVVVDNKAGASGMIGLAEAAKAPSEGYDIVMGQADNMIIALADVVAAAKAAPGSVNYGSAGHGTFPQLAVSLLMQEGGFQLVEVPYKGASPAITDLIGGHVQLAALSVASGMPHIKGGKVRGLVVTSPKRSPDRAPARRDREGDAASRSPAEADRAGRRGALDLGAGLRRDDVARDRQVAQDHEGRRDPAGVGPFDGAAGPRAS
jgi:tripartite-type tricarboxylate transporter receptor subunit TctC